MKKLGLTLGLTATGIMILALCAFNIYVGAPSPISDDELTATAEQTIVDGIKLPPAFRDGFRAKAETTSFAGRKVVEVTYVVDVANGGVLPPKYWKDTRPWSAQAYSKDDHPTNDELKQLAKDAANEIVRKAQPSLASLAKNK